MLTTSEGTANEKKTRTSTWELDPAHSSAEFAVKHLMVSTVTGRFKKLAGRIVLDETNPGNSRAEAEIDTASVDTGIADRDTHLRSADFFDVANHATMTFRTRRIEVESDDRARLVGELTIRGVTRPVTLDVTYDGEITDPWGNRRRGFTADGVLYRKDFGMTWNQILDAGGVLVGDKIKITLNVEAVEKR